MVAEISFVIPAKNEEDSIDRLYEEIITSTVNITKDIELIFIDDGSTDSTFAVMKNLAKKDKRIKIIKLRGNFGKSIALQLGFDRAEGDIVITMDADLQDNPKEIPAMIRKINEGYDLVSGWKKKRNDPISKRVPSLVVNFLVKIMSGLMIHDTNCGFKAYKKELIKNLSLYGDLYRFIPILAYRQNYKVTEIIVDHRARKYGKSKYGWRRFISGWLDLLTVFFLIRYLRRPAHFFGTIGFSSFTLGFVIGLYITYLRFTTGSIQYRQPLLFLGVLLIVIGIQLVSTGLLAEMIINARGKQDYSSSIAEIINA